MKSSKMVTPHIFLRQFRVQTLADVVHATVYEDSTHRRAHIFLIYVVSSTRTPEHHLITHARVLKFPPVTLHM